MMQARDRLALALDVPTVDEALTLGRRLRPYFGIAKVGLELYLAEGPRIVTLLRQEGYEVFADLKLHDIPTTVERAARVVGRLGARYVNAHAAGGLDMLRGFTAGLRLGASEAGVGEPVPLAVTVLTSEADASAFDARLAAAREAGCGGVVCSALEITRVKSRAPGMLVVVPGTRPVAADRHDQVRTAAPGEAVAKGADVLVIGRVVTRARNPEAAAAGVVAEVEDRVTRPG